MYTKIVPGETALKFYNLGQTSNYYLNQVSTRFDIWASDLIIFFWLFCIWQRFSSSKHFTFTNSYYHINNVVSWTQSNYPNNKTKRNQTKYKYPVTISLQSGPSCTVVEPTSDDSSYDFYSRGGEAEAYHVCYAALS